MYGRTLLKNCRLSDINPRVYGQRGCTAGQVIPRHFIELYVLHYVLQGHGRYLVNGHEHAVGPGQIFICRPGDTVSYIADEDDPFTYYWVSFDCSGAFSRLLDAEVITAPWALPFFTNISRVQSRNAEWRICAQLYEFFAQLEEHQSSGSRQKPDYVAQAINYMQTNYAEPLSISTLASQLGLSRNYFCRLFHETTGQSPQDYLIHWRLETAARLLTEHGLSIKDAATQVGYPDVFSFSRMFKRRFGVSPGAYIRSAAQEK